MRRKGRDTVSVSAGGSAHVPDVSFVPSANSPLPKETPPRVARQNEQGGVTTPEPFVTASEAATFLCLKARRVLEMARLGQLPAHPLGIGKRRTWRFRLSELAHALAANSGPQRSDSIYAGSPRDLDREK